MEKFPGVLKKDRHRWVLTEQQQAWLERWYPVTVNRELCQALGISKKSLWLIAEKLNLRKSAEGAFKIRGEAVARCWARLKTENPEAYKRKGTRHSTLLKNLYKKEVRRQMMGLTRETRWHVVMNCYTVSQRDHRYRAFKKGYLLPERRDIENRYVIWWDEDTERSAMFERNLAKDGFTVERYEEKTSAEGG